MEPKKHVSGEPVAVSSVLHIEHFFLLYRLKIVIIPKFDLPMSSNVKFSAETVLGLNLDVPICIFVTW